MASIRDLVTSDDNIELLRNVLTGKRDLDVKDGSGDTLLHTAVKSIYDNPLIVQELINAGADVSILDNLSSTTLHLAVRYGKRKVVDVLLKTAIDIKQRDYWENTALYYAINKYTSRMSRLDTDLYIVRKLLDHASIDVNELDDSRETPLYWAINIDNFEIAKMLLNKNARIDIWDTHRETPLHRALYSHRYRIADALLLKRASLFRVDRDGRFPYGYINALPVEIASTFLKIIAFNYNVEELLTEERTPDPELRHFLNTCNEEINNMRIDVIENGFTVYDFFIKSDAETKFQKPTSQLFKPVVQRLLNGTYPIYLRFILNRMSKSALHAVLLEYNNEKYYESYALEYVPVFLEIVEIRELHEFLTNEEILCLIFAFTNMIEGDFLLGYHEPEWYFSDLWEVYPNGYFLSPDTERRTSVGSLE